MSGASLLHYFDPPAEYAGYFGLVCGYDADAPCVNSMTERFCCLTKTRRAQQGHQSLVFMLDASSDFVGCAECGALRVPLKYKKTVPYKMLHAKVALLAFQHMHDASRWRLRVLVSTGNWTTQTVEHSLDLMWSVEVDSTSLDDPLACADIKAAWSMLQWLCGLHNISVLSAPLAWGRISATAEHWQTFCKWVDGVSRRGKGPSRFFDTRKKSLLAQLPTLIDQHAGSGRRNYLVMGSGFFETNPGSDPQEHVLQSIVRELQENGVLLKSAGVEIIVNEHSCQGIAKAKDSIVAQNWTINRPTHSLEAHRTLHAKFLFAAYEDDSNPKICRKPWVYLGSGNLTHPGFMKGMSPSGGNLEAGVVFHPGELVWYPYKDYLCISDVLPVAWTDPPPNPLNLDSLAYGEDFPDKEPAFLEPPVSYVLWEDQALRLPSPEEGSVSCQIFAPDGKPCPERDGLFTWTASRPIKVDIGWQEEGKTMIATVPVMDEYGNMGAVIPPAQSLAEALDRLGDFPLMSDSDEPEEEGEDRSGGAGTGASHASPLSASYPVRSIMTMVERIAEKQTALTEAEWPRWCMRLEQTLVDMKDCGDVAAIVAQLHINPLHALRAEPFRPPFAAHADTEAGSMYERALTAIEEAWGVKHKHPLGEA